MSPREQISNDTFEEKILNFTWKRKQKNERLLQFKKYP